MLEAQFVKSIAGFNLRVDLTVNNEVVALFGPSGSGKSMTLQCLAGLLKPDAGSIVLNQRVLFDSVAGTNRPPQERRVGFVFQNYALFPHLTVEQNIAFGLRQLRPEGVEDKVALLIKKIKLTGLENRFPHQLSGGQQQRVAMARALAIEPEILLLDEPFSALDSQVKDELEQEILAIQEYYQGDVILITHDLREAYSLSSKIAVLDGGKILQYADKAKIIAKPRSKKVGSFTGMKNFLAGRIAEGLPNGRAKVETVTGAMINCGAGDYNLVPGQLVQLGIRPEHLEITEGGVGENYLPAKLIKIKRDIATSHLSFKINTKSPGDQEVLVDTIPQNTLNLRIGLVYSLFLPPEKVVLLTE